MKKRKILLSLSTILLSTVLMLGQAAQALSVSMTEEEKQMFATRAEFSHALAELLRDKGVWGTEKESDGFSDISPEQAYYADILLLEEIGVVNGDGNGNFRPDDLITYQEAVAMLGRSFRGDEWIVRNFGAYPDGYTIFAMQEGLTQGVAMQMNMPVMRGNMEALLRNTGEKIKVYPDLVQKLGCDTYTGHVYIDYYPKHWQGYSKKPIDSSTGYFHIVPEKVLYSYDNETWHVLSETIDGKTVCYGLPDYIEAARFDWAYEVFQSVPIPYDPEKLYYSYDFKTWHKGSLPTGKVKTPVLLEQSFPFGIEGAALFEDEETGLYFSFRPYEKEYYISKTYGVELVESKSNVVWASKDQVNWVGIRIPEEAHYYKIFSVRSNIQALFLSCAVDFTEEEQQYLDGLEKEAAEKKLGYDRPQYKYEKYIIPFDDILKLL
ncbi:MAG: S-layer homology domain-containing protein [Clostridia bacterium]|nr:S-layer homology domain-containing protein [Clostridia bacterium]